MFIIFSEKAFSLVELVISIAINAITISILTMLFINNIYQKKQHNKTIEKESFQNTFNHKMGELPDIQKKNINFLFGDDKIKHQISATPNKLVIPINLGSKGSWLKPLLKTQNQDAIELAISSFTFFKPKFQKYQNTYKITNAKILLSLCIENKDEFISQQGQTIDSTQKSVSLAYLVQSGHHYPFYNSTDNQISCCKIASNNEVSECELANTDFLIRTYSVNIGTNSSDKKYIKHIQELPSPHGLNSVWGSGFFISYVSKTVVKISSFYQYPVCLGKVNNCPKLGLTPDKTNLKNLNIPLKTKVFFNSVNVLLSPFEGGPIYLY